MTSEMIAEPFPHIHVIIIEDKIQLPPPDRLLFQPGFVGDLRPPETAVGPFDEMALSGDVRPQMNRDEEPVNRMVRREMGR